MARSGRVLWSLWTSPSGRPAPFRDVWTSRGRRQGVAHRVAHTRGPLAHKLHRTAATTPFLYGFWEGKADGKKRLTGGGLIRAGAPRFRDIAFARTGPHLRRCGRAAAQRREDREAKPDGMQASSAGTPAQAPRRASANCGPVASCGRTGRSGESPTADARQRDAEATVPARTQASAAPGCCGRVAERIEATGVARNARQPGDRRSRSRRRHRIRVVHERERTAPPGRRRGPRDAAAYAALIR